MKNEPRRPPGLEAVLRDPEPIRTERQAQQCGHNVHSIASARDRRDHVIWSIDGPDEAA